MKISTRQIVAGLMGFAMVLTLVVGVAAVSTASAATSTTFARNLTVGNTGSDVTALQGILNEQGYLSVSPTGYFGALTKAAVKAWQAVAGLPATGYFGPLSRAAIGSASNNGGGTTSTPGCSAGASFNSMTG